MVPWTILRHLGSSLSAVDSTSHPFKQSWAGRLALATEHERRWRVTSTWEPVEASVPAATPHLCHSDGDATDQGWASVPAQGQAIHISASAGHMVSSQPLAPLLWPENSWADDVAAAGAAVPARLHLPARGHPWQHLLASEVRAPCSTSLWWMSSPGRKQAWRANQPS